MTAPAARLRTVGPTEIAGALASALDGGPPVAPLPARPRSNGAGPSAVLRPDQPVTEPDAAVGRRHLRVDRPAQGGVLSRAAIRASVEATHARLGGPGDWVLALPGHYVAGLMVLARTVLGRHPGLAGPRRPARTCPRR